MGAMAALTYAGVSLSLNRYKDRLNFEGNNRARLAAKFDEISALLEAGDRPADPDAGDRSLEACEEDQIRTLIAALRENEDLVVQGTSVRSPGQLLDYIQAKLEWRDHVWAKLPACRLSIGVGRQMSQTASDLATAVAFSYAQVPGPENPFAGRLQDDLTLLGDLLVFLISEIGEQVAADVESPLPACTAADKAAVADKLSTFDALIKQAFGIETTDDLLAFSDELIMWRSEIWSAVPFCSESVEISLVATNTVNDFAALQALELSGEPADVSLIDEKAMDGLFKILAFTTDYQDSNAAAAAVAQADSIPACTESAKPYLLSIREQMGIFASLISEFRSVDDIVKYGEVHIHWRDQIWKKFPPCQESIKAGQLMIQVTGDTVPAAAMLFFLGVPQEDNPFLNEITEAREKLETYTTMFGHE
ncbi:MAG: hypothetical protein OXG78_08665 [Chloroflexi bacterium]|nr:hypothetical protein [Chloroflexota bacterium]